MTNPIAAALDRHCPNCGAAPREVCSIEVERAAGDNGQYLVRRTVDRHIPCISRMVGTKADREALVAEAEQELMR